MAYLDRRTAQPDPRRRAGMKRLGAMRSVVVTTLGLAVVLVAACSDSNNPAQLGGGPGVDSGQGDPCAVPNEGCSCKGEGVTVQCGEVTTRSGDYVTCSEGHRTCAAGKWSACVGDHTVFKSIRPVTNVGGGIHVADYGVPVVCMSNPCDPDCQNFPDNSNGVDAGGLVPIDGGFTLQADAPPPDAIANGCVGLQCQLAFCADGGVNGTKLTGKVYDPASLNPIYDAIVAVPNGAVPVPPTGVPRPAGACGGVTLPPVVTYTNTAYDGSFTLTGVPAGSNIPILIQSGQWQRIVNINVTACATTNISTGCNGLNNYAGTAGCLTRLPRTQAEGHIPKIAMGTGGLDAMECLLYRMGVSSNEFTDENGAGRVNVFTNGGATLAGGANHDISYLLGFTCPNGARCPGTSGNSLTGLTNPSLETGTLAGWTVTGTATASNAAAFSGTWSALLGSTSVKPTNNSTLAQTFTAPSHAATFSFNANSTCAGGGNGFSALLHDNTANTNTTWANVCLGGGWGAYTAPGIVPGHSYTLTVTNKDTVNNFTYTYVDNV